MGDKSKSSFPSSDHGSVSLDSELSAGGICGTGPHMTDGVDSQTSSSTKATKPPFNRTQSGAYKRRKLDPNSRLM